MQKTILLAVSLVLFLNSFSQKITGYWEYYNEDNEKVTIYLGNENKYKLFINGKDLDGIERINGESIPANYNYKINFQANPNTIDITSRSTKTITKGIIQLNKDGTLQIQFNPIYGGDYPRKFDPNSPKYILLKKSSIPIVKNEINIFLENRKQG